MTKSVILHSTMKKLNLTIALIIIFATSVFAQKQFSDPNVKYTFLYPETNWKMSVKPSDVSPNPEFVYEYKRRGHFEIRKMKVKQDTLFGEMIKQEETSLQFLPGYVAGREANFRGALSGRVFNFEFLRSGRNMSGRYYFLRVDTTTIYVLRFTGLKDNMRAIRPEMDSISRTFKEAL